MRSLERLFNPRSIAVIGGGFWSTNVVRECRKIGFPGPIWPVHHSRAEVAGLPAVASLDDLPEPPDAVFIGVNRETTVELVRALSRSGAGGAVCFASGFREAIAELGDGASLQDALVEAAGDMPVLGPNCYGFVNALAGAALWPDQHGMARVESGVAIVTQSSNMAINFTMQQRGLPLAYTVTAGNQAQIGLAGIGAALLEDPRVTALGLHIEGVGDLAALENLSRTAKRLGKPVVVLKIGASEQARAATISHTASLAGSDAGASALLARLGFARVGSPAAFLETLKLLHVVGPLPSNRIASLSCSGGEASLMADSVLPLDLEFPPLNQAQREGLRSALGPKVALANPLDYHTYIWGDLEAMTRCYAAMLDPSLAMGIVVLDFPRGDRCSTEAWEPVIDAVGAAQAEAGVPLAILATLPECMPELFAQQLTERGIVALCGLNEGLEAVEAAAWLGRPRPELPNLLPAPNAPGGEPLSEREAKTRLAGYGLEVPRSEAAASPEAAGAAAETLGLPVVLKGEGQAHKTGAGLIALGLTERSAVAARAEAMACGTFLVEEMVSGGVVELILGVTADPAHGFILTIGAGGVLTELLRDSRSLLVPAEEAEVTQALDSLRIAPMIAGYRGAPAANKDAIVAAVMALQAFVMDHAGTLSEVEINPLICTPERAVAADALIRFISNQQEAGNDR